MDYLARGLTSKDQIIRALEYELRFSEYTNQNRSETICTLQNELYSKEETIAKLVFELANQSETMIHNELRLANKSKDQIELFYRNLDDSKCQTIHELQVKLRNANEIIDSQDTALEGMRSLKDVMGK